MSQYAPPPHIKIGGQKRPKIGHTKSGVKKTVVGNSTSNFIRTEENEIVVYHIIVVFYLLRAAT